MNVCYYGGMNFGWPIFEGMEQNGPYLYALAPNPDAPNPLYGQAGCTKPYFDFQDLIAQETFVHPPGLPNPCDPNVMIPPNIHTFTNSRPVIDWVHGNESRCSAFDGNTAVYYDLDDPNSPVPGPRFGGNASVGGTFLTGTGWPSGYQDNYFMADYAGAWIRRVVMSPDNKAVQVYNFGTYMGAVVFVKEGPDGSLWYVRYETGQIRKISPLGVTNLPPAAVAQQDTLYGASPLTVQFTGSNSTDPESGTLTYLWDFGDGGTSTSANPSHVFTVAGGAPTVFNVSLTVTDDHSQTSTANLTVNVNNTPPQVAITSFPDGQLYPVGVDTTITLEADASDAESATNLLTYTWQTVLHHNNHVHAEPLDHNPTSTTVISGVGCYEDNFSYVVTLTVTDPGGLSTTVTNHLYPNCAVIAPTAVISSGASYGPLPFATTLDGSGSVDNGTIVNYSWDFGDGTTATGAQVPKTFDQAGDYQVTLTVTDNDGLTNTTTKVFTVYTLEPPQCAGSAGSTISSLINSGNYPDSPNGTTYPTSIRGPVNFANNYGTRMRGYIVPSTTGDYTFNTTSDDASVFYLSPNANPAFMQAICSVPGWTNDTEYNKFSSQQSDTVHLVAGAYYYFEFLQKEGSGGDHMTVRWTQPGNSTLTVVDAPNLVRWEDCPPGLEIRLALDGPYDPATGLMDDDLRAMGYLPLTEPYTALGYTQVGGGGETVPQSVMDVTGKNAVVDWVLVELRSKANSSVVLATQCALLQRDGDVVGVDGYSRLIFNVPEDMYYVAVRQRNHLGVMTASQVVLDGSTPMVDFTNTATATYGTNAEKRFPNGKQGLWAGNAVDDGRLKFTGSSNDADAMLQAIGGVVPTAVTTGYMEEDANMDGFVRYTGASNDRDLLLQNIGGLVPTAVRVEQLP
jgi:PKD repeat protein